MNSTMTDEMRKYCIDEYDKYLTANGVDTVCFMGYGYSIEDVKIGAEFYLSYLFWCKKCDDTRAISAEPFAETLQACLAWMRHNYTEILLTDRFKLVKKYRFRAVNFFGVKIKEEEVFIRNLRTNKLMKLNDEWIDAFYLFNFDTW